MRRWLQILVAATSAVLLLAATTLAALIGLSAECTGSTEDCPHSDTYRGVLLTVPVVAALLLVAGTAWSIRRRTLSPLALAEAATLAVAALVDAILNTPDIGTMVLLALAAGIGAAALRRATQPPRER